MLDGIALVIGNGESRAGINLQNYTGKIEMVGCNAVHRDAIVDHLVCCDNRMIIEALEDVNTVETLIYVRDDWYHHYKKMRKNKNIRPMPDIPYVAHGRPDHPRNWGSGTYALLVAAGLGKKDIYMLGFDLYGNKTLVNNLYKGTKNYSDQRSQAIDPSYWIYQSSKIFHIFKDTNFIVVNQPQWQIPKEWCYSNVELIDLDKFREAIDLQLNSVYNIN